MTNLSRNNEINKSLAYYVASCQLMNSGRGVRGDGLRLNVYSNPQKASSIFERNINVIAHKHNQDLRNKIMFPSTRRQQCSSAPWRMHGVRELL